MFNRKLKARIAELESQLKTKDATNERLFEKMGKYVKKVDTLEKQLEAKREVEPFRVKRMVGLKFRALFNGLYQPTEFKTGPGPCGKTVTHFTTSRTERELTIHQHHTDGSQKDFEYRLSDIDGRIQYDYENVQVYGEEAERERARYVFLRRQRFA
ncbi:hypothetical protein HOV18_gp18 [Cronobacter phage GW1]|uniref:Uncharacterized protein n=1 Tax=Cronobacter phage GW1 TaxID=2200756 RepID=A0A3S7N8N8_9CAUD|nr:hypothetical protein HOV18_gp18 [Cronobacter phage GW1]AWY03131.1 hypothetical protein GW1_00018 [Cronobacter phage GW1]